ncbi:MAG: bifunctional phosphoribosylaminoimidazolecarboxamide formyltransferase/IMP cyclohydrolase, partial [Candidatus Neomarinimicrobiota bacterium]
GPSLLRAAAKNHRHVVVLCRPGQYDDFLRLYSEHGGEIPAEERVALAAEVFERTSGYDLEIADGLGLDGGELPTRLRVGAQLQQALRYGENPHQRAGFYLSHAQSPPWNALHGKELSFNNYADVDCAVEAVGSFAEPAAVIVKHANPCGFGLGATLEQAYRRALATDPVSSFGGIVGLNRRVDESAARAMAELFLECIVAPEFSPEALAVLTRKKNLRLLEGGADQASGPVWDLRTAAGGYLLQERDGADGEEFWEIVSRRKPSTDEMQSMRLGWKMVRFVKSNAIVLAGLDGLLGVGAGQMSRVDAVILAGMKAARSQQDLSGAVLASDAFFPFPDGLEEAARLGVTAVIQPGGSVRDKEVIARADEEDMAMIHTHTRHFRH